MANVILVEDDTDIRRLVHKRLLGDGHRVTAAANGPEALKLVDDGTQPDVAVLDILMPHMDGFELAEALRERPGLKHLPIIFLTAQVQVENIERGKSLGAFYLTKPFIASALRNAVAQATLPKEADVPY